MRIESIAGGGNSKCKTLEMGMRLEDSRTPKRAWSSTRNEGWSVIRKG